MQSLGKGGALPLSFTLKPSKEVFPEYKEQDAKQGQEDSSQSGLGVSCELAPAAKSCVG
jgi:hypothetical protein